MSKNCFVLHNLFDKRCFISFQTRVKALIKAGADVNAKADSGYTALILVASKEDSKMVDTLIKMGADVNIISDNGHTALSEAKQNGNTEIANMLIKAGAKR